jgi:hypothetical protein
VLGQRPKETPIHPAPSSKQSPKAAGAWCRAPQLAPRSPPSGVRNRPEHSFCMHSPPQSTDVRRTQEQQQQQPEAGGHGWQHSDLSTTGGGRGQEVRLRSEPVRAAAPGFRASAATEAAAGRRGLCGRRGGPSRARRARRRRRADGAASACVSSGARSGEEIRAGGGGGRGARPGVGGGWGTGGL